MQYIKTGVVNINNVTNLYEELIYNGINVSAEEREKEFYQHIREENNLPDDYDFDSNSTCIDQSELDRIFEEDSCDTILIGFIKNEKTGLYEEDPKAEYSCVIGELWGFVTRSKYMCKCNKGSPCIPNQCDLETEGDEIAYTLPAEIWDNDKPEWMNIIKIEGEHTNLSGILNKI